MEESIVTFLFPSFEATVKLNKDYYPWLWIQLILLE